jgi:hypothetical protein
LNEKHCFISLPFVFHFRVSLVTDSLSFISGEPKTTDACFHTDTFVGPDTFRISSTWTAKDQGT